MTSPPVPAARRSAPWAPPRGSAGADGRQRPGVVDDRTSARADTGGDSGVGRAAAIAFAREGADVAFGCLPQEESDAREVVELIRKAGRKAVPLPGDIRDEAFCQKLVADAILN